MSNLSVLEKFIDCSVFQQNNYIIPEIRTTSIERCCKQIKYAMLTKSHIFIYGDYDVDGMMSMLVWKSILISAGYNNFTLYKYSSRTHAIQTDIVQQAKECGAQQVIICDTGSGAADRVVIRNLRAMQMEVIIIDHHTCEYGYSNLQKEAFVFNSYEERAALNNEKVSGAYASLLVANILCTKHLNILLSNDAKYYALASMYSDVVDMSTTIAIALYNHVILQHAPLPKLFQALNTHGYKVGRRFFQYMISPALNNCFRAGAFDLLNQTLASDDYMSIFSAVKKISEMHDKTRNLVRVIYNTVTKKRYGAITLCFYENTKKDGLKDLAEYTGILANMVASDVGSAVICMTKVNGGYKGSLRDPQGRNLLSAVSSFAEAGGHPSAFGLRVADSKFNVFLKSLEIFGNSLEQSTTPKFTVISSEYIQDMNDLFVLALYNEFMNTKNIVYIKLNCSHVVLHHKTAWYKYYSVGLPIPVKTVTPLISGTTILLEPCICRDIELREVVV